MRGVVSMEKAAAVREPIAALALANTDASNIWRRDNISESYASG